MDDSDALPIEFVYGPDEAGARITLYEGPAELGDVSGHMQVFVDLACGGEWAWEFDTQAMLDVGDSPLRFTDPLCGQAGGRALVLSTQGRGLILQADLGDGEPVDSAILHWFNLPWLLPASNLNSETGAWAGRTTIAAGTWDLTLDVRPDHTEALSARRRSDSLVTHVGRLRRSDGTLFTVADLEDAVIGVQVAVSFALAAWVSPGPAVLMREGRTVGGLWRPWRNDRQGTANRWLNVHRSQDLEEFCRLYMAEWESGGQRKALVRYFAMHVIEASRHGSIEARVLVLASAIQYLHWITYVVDAGLKDYAGGEPPLPVKLRDLLNAAGVPCEVPADLEALARAWSGPGG